MCWTPQFLRRFWPMPIILSSSSSHHVIIIISISCHHHHCYLSHPFHPWHPSHRWYLVTCVTLTPFATLWDMLLCHHCYPILCVTLVSSRVLSHHLSRKHWQQHCMWLLWFVLLTLTTFPASTDCSIACDGHIAIYSHSMPHIYMDP